MPAKPTDKNRQENSERMPSFIPRVRNNDARRMYTVAETAKVLGIGRSTAYELVNQGEIEAVRIGKRWLVSPAVLENILGERPPLPCELWNESPTQTV